MLIVADIDNICTFCLSPATLRVDVPGFSCYTVCGREDCQRTLRYFQLLKETDTMSTTREITVTQFCGLFNLKLKVEQVDANPYSYGDWGWNVTHYKCRIRMYPVENPKENRVQLTSYFSKGYARNYGVELPEFLACLASDSADINSYPDVEEFAADFGVEVTKEVKRGFRKATQTKDMLEKMFGSHFLDTLMYHTQRM